MHNACYKAIITLIQKHYKTNISQKRKFQISIPYKHNVQYMQWINIFKMEKFFKNLANRIQQYIKW